MSALMHFAGWACGRGEACHFPLPLVFAGSTTAATSISSSSSAAVASSSTSALRAVSEGAAEARGKARELGRPARDAPVNEGVASARRTVEARTPLLQEEGQERK